MQDVARTAGVSKGIIHYYFLNKDDLMMAVLSKVAGDIEVVLSEDMIDTETPLERISAFMAVVFDVVRKTREYYQVNMDFWTQINQKDEVRKIIASHYAKFRETAQKVIDEGIEKGQFKKVNSSQYAAYMIAVIDGLSLQYLFDAEAFNYDQIVTSTTTMILDGLKA